MPDDGPTAVTNTAELDAVHEQPVEVVTETENSPPLELMVALDGSLTVKEQADGCDAEAVLGDVGPLFSLQAANRPIPMGTNSHIRILETPRIGR